MQLLALADSPGARLVAAAILFLTGLLIFNRARLADRRRRDSAAMRLSAARNPYRKY